MKLSLSTDAMLSHIIKGMSDREVIETIGKTGFKTVDYDLTVKNINDPENMGRELRKAFEDFGVTGYQAHAVGYDYANPSQRDKMGFLRNCFVFCKNAGIPRIVVHPSAIPGNTREEFFEMNISFYKSVIPLCEETGVELLIENIGNPMDPYFLIDGADLREMVDAVDHPMCSACWDIGHANHFSAKEHPQYNSITSIGDKLTAIHFHDNAGNFDDPQDHIRVDMHALPYVSWVTNVNYDAVIQGLIDINYKGTFNFEVSGAKGRNFVVPFFKDGVVQDKIMIPPVELWIKIYSTLYEIGKYMLDSYGVFEG